ncbi:ParB/RepB/Spo0J family partition protein [Asticcacaulis endophyticus]|uniref:Chromosome partitioning protein ParB n=1 Tax=Asticcacaulis endophyticus TaxID=1395890 RepID=A0A918UWP3_9CAUL|nr:plasmid partitioning protein RepB C-terminal domain-containing protein [Asticcacaulis endophyticus]GGZ39285.1 chromosome partitioning protein ParB [Asticcacaulis endophyticus]
MSGAKGLRVGKIAKIPIDRINILNPRARNQKIFFDMATNMTQVGMKRPIMVTACRSGTADKDYDLICGQGRLEAFLACGQIEIPAMIIDASEEQALIMSLVENLARRQHRSADILQGVEILAKQGYDAATIGKKTGMSTEYVDGILNLMAKGEQRLLTAVENGQIPMYLAIRIAEGPEEEQLALQDAYESNQLRGNRLLLAKKLMDTRRRCGKAYTGQKRVGREKSQRAFSGQDVMKVFQRELDRKRLLTKKADIAATRLTFVTQALRELTQDENFCTLLRAEGLNTLPKPLASLMSERGGHHGF